MCVTTDHLHVHVHVYRYLSKAPNGEQLLLQLIEQMLFNAHLWTRASNEVHVHVFPYTLMYCMM